MVSISQGYSSPLLPVGNVDCVTFRFPDDVQQHGKMHYFDRKIGGNSKTLKSQQMMSSPARHDYPYFTGTTDGYKHNKSNRHNDNSPNSISKYPNSGSNAELLQSQKPIPNYPSFKKKIMHYAQSSSTPAQTKSPSHRDTFGPDDDVPAATMQFSGRDFNTNRHSWISGGGGAGVAYNHHQKQMPMSYVGAGPNSSYATEEPVYEEIMSNRVFDMEDGEDNMNRRRNKRPRPYDVHGEYDDKKRYGYGNSDNATRLVTNGPFTSIRFRVTQLVRFFLEITVMLMMARTMRTMTKSTDCV